MRPRGRIHSHSRWNRLLAFSLFAAASGTFVDPALAQSSSPAPVEGDYAAREFHFADGEAMANLRLHYTTLGAPQRDAAGHINNAVLLLHGTTGTGRNFLAPSLADPLFAPGKPLDASRFYLVMPDGIGAGGSSKPSEGMRSHFPRYGYGDQVEAQFRLLKEGLGIDHLRLVLGTSMGGMQAWLWAERHPQAMDATVAVAATPAPIAGRNMLWRKLVIDAIRSDPGWHGGDYTAQPTEWRRILPLFTLMTGSAARLQFAAPTRSAAIELADKTARAGESLDAGDYLASFESSADYDPAGDLDKIQAPLLAINFGDDLLNPPELGQTAAAMTHVRGGRAMLIPAGPTTYGHQTLTHAEVWGPALGEFLRALPAPEDAGSAKP